MPDRHPPFRTSRRPRGARLRRRRRKHRGSSKLAWIVLVLGAISAAAIAIYGIWGRQFAGDVAWRELSSELRSRDEPLTYEEVIPPEISAGQNFLTHPIWKQEAMKEIVAKRGGRTPSELLRTASQPDGSVDLSPIADVFADQLDSEYLLPADQVRAGMSKAGIDLRAVREAAGRTGARQPLDYTVAFPELPHLAALEAAADWLVIDALTRIETGNGTAATDDLETVVRLADAVATEPFLASQQLRRKLLSLVAGCARLGISSKAFTRENLQSLARVLIHARLLMDFSGAIRGERARLNDIVDGRLDPGADGGIVSRWLGVEPLQADKRDLQSRRVVANRLAQDFLDQLTSGSGIEPSALLPPAEITPPERLVELTAEAKAFAQVQAYLTQAATACALEEFHLVNGRYPPALDELVPQFLPGVPLDPMTGRALSYEHADRGYTLTSTGWDGAWIWKN